MQFNTTTDKMQQFINDYLTEVYRDFNLSIINLESLCALKDLRFDYGNMPDYSKSEIQQLYLLRYFYAYLSEYYFFYKELLKEYKFEEINVLSLGAGSFIDYYGLCFALNEFSFDIGHAKYLGIDKIDWQYKYSEYSSLPSVSQCYHEIEDLLNLGRIDQNINIIVFPRSLGEFSDAAFYSLLNRIEKTNFKSNKIYILSFFRASKEQADCTRYKKIIEVFGTLNYDFHDNPEKFWSIDERIKSFYKINGERRFPDSIINLNFFTNLPRLCQKLNCCPNHFGSGFCNNENTDHFFGRRCMYGPDNARCQYIELIRS